MIFLNIFIIFEVASIKHPPAAATYSTDLGADPPQGKKFAHGKIQESVPLERGDDGFVVAKFSDGKHSFGLPCLVLDNVGKGTHSRPEAKAAAKKKKAAKAKAKAAKKAAKKNAALKRPAAAVPGAAPSSGGFGPMWYKKTFIAGLRSKTGTKPQVVSFGGVNYSNKAKEDMMDIGYKMCKELERGASYASVKAEGIRLANELDDVA